MKKLFLTTMFLAMIGLLFAQTDTLTYPLDNASGASLFGVQAGPGYVTGTNNFTLEVGNMYDYAGSGTVTGALIWFGAKEVVGTPDSFSVKVYNTGADSLPSGGPVAETRLSILDIDTSTSFSFMYVPFNNANISGRFVVAVQVDDPTTNDTLALVSNSDGDGMGLKRSVVKAVDQSWYRLADLWGTPPNFLDIDNFILPIVEASSGVVCTPPAPTGVPGFTPAYTTFPCAEQGVPYNEVVHFENFDTVNSSFGPIIVNWLRIDSITNLPCNLSWETDRMDHTYNGGETACINITGTTNDQVGQYEWDMYVTIEISNSLIGTQQFPGDVESLAQQLGGLGVSLGTDVTYWIRVKAAAQACVAIDTSLGSLDACASQQQGGNCDTLTNIMVGATPTLFGNNSGGNVLGHNGDGFPAFAEYFSNSSNVEIPSASFWFGEAQYGSASSAITVTVWDASGSPGFFGNPNAPGSVLATESVLISDIATDVTNNQFTNVSFSSPATVTGDFFVGFQVTHAAGDTVGLVSNGDGETVPATAWVSIDNFVSGEWSRVDSLFGGLSISGYVFPKVCEVQAPCPTISVSATTANAICGSSSGSATASASGGTGPYTYSWSDGQSTTTATGLAPGGYLVVATDVNGCTGSASVTVMDTTITINVSTSTVNNINCSNSNGTASATPSNGVAPYTYAWDAATGNQSSVTATGLAAGTYSVTIYDVNGCSGTASATVSDSLPTITVSTDSTVLNTSCSTPNGSATVSASGGAGPYTYAWDANTGSQTGATASGLTGGSYDVTATDANGCTGTASVTVGSSTPVITVSTNLTTPNSSCSSPNGTAAVVASGGTAGYTYQWDVAAGSQTGPIASGLTGGSYDVTATDANGCTGTTSVTVGSSTPVITVSSSSTTPNTSCSNPNGAATVSASGGSAPYTYAWDAAAANQTGTTASNLTGGTYSVTATDANGCTGTTSVTVADNASISVTIISSNPVSSCVNDNGSLTAQATGGGSVTYTWSTSPTQNSATASGLAAGSYTVTAMDNISGCTATATATVGTNLPTITASITSSNNVTNCTTPNGSATASGSSSSGSGTFTYEWSTVPAQTSATASSLSAGNYTVTVTHSSGCTASANVTISDNTANVSVNISTTNVTSCASPNGSVTATASNGATPYTYEWSNSQTGATLTGLSAGSYTVTVTDANGCEAVGSTTVGSSTTNPSVTVSTTDESQVGAADGSASATATGGTTPYTYSWSDGQTTATASGLSAGNYTVTVTDANGCSAMATATVDVNTGISDIDALIDFSLFPNPTTGVVNINMELNKSYTVRIEWFSILGEKLNSEDFSQTNVVNQHYNLAQYPAGIYFTRITFGENAIIKKVNLDR